MTFLQMTNSNFQMPQDAWRSPLLTQRKGFITGRYLGRIQGAYVNGRFVEQSEVNTALLESIKNKSQRRDQAITPRGFRHTPISFGGGESQRVGPGWDAPVDATRWDLGEIELVINGDRWIEVEGKWHREDDYGG